MFNSKNFVKSWEKTREKGKWRYIARWGLLLGALMSFINLIPLRNIKDLKQDFNPYFFIIIATYLGAFFIVATIWSIKEREYQRRLAKNKQND